MSDVQALVDALAAEIGRPVGLDDRRFRAIAYSAHLDDVDEVRRTSILRRAAPEAVTTWLESVGVSDARGLARVPGNPSLGMAARVCVPVRFQEALLGYLWLIDEPDPVNAEEGGAAIRYATELGVELYRLRRLDREERIREAELLSALLDGVGNGEETAGELAQFLTGGSYAVLVLHPLIDGVALDGPEVRVRLAAALEQLRHTVPPRQFAMRATHEEAVAVIMVDSAGSERRARAMLAAAEDQFAEVDGFSASVGVGSARSRLAVLRESYLEAARAARIGASIRGSGPVVVFSDLGSYRTISGLVGGSDPSALLPASVAQLLSGPEAATLVTTLETYLDSAGDAQAAAAALFVHRSTLYHRLHRIEELLGVDLRAGDDRLELHLGLRLWRMAGSPIPEL